MDQIQQFLDADVFLTNPNVLKYLVSLKHPIVAPLLNSNDIYSNFWTAMTENYYYDSTDEYNLIVKHEDIGVHAVPLVHSAVLIDVNLADLGALTFDKKYLQNKLKKKNQTYDGPYDDIITFAVSANLSGIPMYVSNRYHFGYMFVPLDTEDSITKDYEQLRNILGMILSRHSEVKIVKSMQPFIKLPEKDRLGFSKIFMINFERYPERRRRMEHNFNVLGLEVEIIPAVDENKMSNEWLEEQKKELMFGFLERTMNFDEIGRFLSHYLIWERIVKENLELVLILEDDIHFEPNIQETAKDMIDQAKKSGSDWDLIYFGREPIKSFEEKDIYGTDNLISVSYSHGTYGYVLTLMGAKKLMDSKPLSNLLTLDEYLTIMYNKHPKEEYFYKFPKRNLIALSADPLLIHRMYTTLDGQYMSMSDTVLTENVDDDLTGDDTQRKGDKDDYDSTESLFSDLEFQISSYNLDIGINEL